MIKVASISEINNEFVKLKLNSETNCNDCKSRCSDGFLDFLFHKKNKSELLVAKQKVNSTNEIQDVNGFFNSNKKVGDTIGVKFSDKDLMLLSALLYAVPIVLILLLLPLAYVLGPQININADLSGFIGFVLSLILSKILIYNCRAKFSFKIDFFE